MNNESNDDNSDNDSEHDDMTTRAVCLIGGRDGGRGRVAQLGGVANKADLRMLTLKAPTAEEPWRYVHLVEASTATPYEKNAATTVTLATRKRILERTQRPLPPNGHKSPTDRHDAWRHARALPAAPLCVRRP